MRTEVYVKVSFLCRSKCKRGLPGMYCLASWDVANMVTGSVHVVSSGGKWVIYM